jgi:hypothetical protein
MKKILSIVTGLAISASAFSINIIPGWQLVGTEHDINISTFNNPNIISVWTYDKINKKWKAYIPNKNINLSKYGIEPLTKINAKDGFWINALNNLTLNSEINQTNNITNEDKNLTNDTNNSNIAYLIPDDPLKQTTLFPGKYPGMYPNYTAFAALKKDGTVVTWGDDTWGGDSSSVADKLNNIIAIYSTNGAFAALKDNGIVVTWGSSSKGGNNSSVDSNLTNVKTIYSTVSAFAALKNDGTVVTWGHNDFGGNSSSVTYYLTNIKTIYSTGAAFAALKNDGTVVTWGGCGGDSSSVIDKLNNIVGFSPSYTKFPNQ